MRYLLIAGLLVLSHSAMSQQDQFQWRMAAHGGITRSLGDIESSYSDVNWERSRSFGLELSKSMGYGFSLGLGVERARVSGNDMLTGRKDRALNFMTELNTAELALTFRADNGKLLKYDARFAPFITLRIGVGEYDVYGDLYSASGSRYYYWNDGSIRDQAESGINADEAAIIEQDGQFGTRLTTLATEDGKPNDQNFMFIPARIGLKWRISDRVAAELYYGFNWAFTDWIDDVHDAYPNRAASDELAYISNPTGRNGQRGNPDTNDKYQSVGVNLAYYFGRRSNSYRMEPIYVDDRSLPTIPDTTTEYSIPEAELDSILMREAVLDTIYRDGLRSSLVERMEMIGPDSLRRDLADRSLIQALDTTTLTATDSVQRMQSDTLIAPPSSYPERDSLQELGHDTVTPLLEDTTNNTRMDTARAGGALRGTQQQSQDSLVGGRSGIVQDTVMATGEQGAVKSPVDTVYVDRPVPVTRSTGSTSPKAQEPQQTIIHQSSGGGGNHAIPLPIPIVIPHSKAKVVEDPALQDSLQRLEAENQKLRLLVDSLQSDTAPFGTYGTPVARLDTTPAPPGVRPEDYAFIINDLLAERILTLERYIEVMDNQTNAAETDSLKRCIVAMDRELERLRSEGGANKDGAEVIMPKHTERTLTDSISFGLGSSRVGAAERGRLLALGKQITSEKVERVLVTGQTDRSGDRAYNLQLSQKRADAVKRILVEAGVPSASIIAKGLGDELARDVHNESERIVVVQVVKPAMKKQE